MFGVNGHFSTCKSSHGTEGESAGYWDNFSKNQVNGSHSHHVKCGVGEGSVLSYIFLKISATSVGNEHHVTVCKA